MQLYCRQYSASGAPLVILHGLYGNQGNWAAAARAFSDTFAVYALDARNHGQSEWATSMTLQEMARDVVETLQGLGLEQVDLIGHSMGGKIAMLVALQHPQLVRALVVVDIAPVDYHKPVDGVLQAMLQLPLQNIGSRAQADQLLAHSIEEVGVRNFLLTNLVRSDSGGFRWRINLPVIAEFFGALTGWQEPEQACPNPTLFIRGELSPYILPEHQQQTMRQFPNAQVKTVAGAGHWVHSEKPEAVQRLIRNFLQDV